MWCYSFLSALQPYGCWWEIFVNWILVHNFQGWSNYSVLFRYVTTSNILKQACVLTASSNMQYVIICTPHRICCMEHKSAVPYSFKRLHFEVWREISEAVDVLQERGGCLGVGNGKSTLITIFTKFIQNLLAIVVDEWLMSQNFLHESPKSWSRMTSHPCGSVKRYPGETRRNLRIWPRTLQSQGLWPVPLLPRGIIGVDNDGYGWITWLVDIGWWFHDSSLGINGAETWVLTCF